MAGAGHEPFAFRAGLVVLEGERERWQWLPNRLGHGRSKGREEKDRGAEDEHNALHGFPGSGVKHTHLPRMAIPLPWVCKQKQWFAQARRTGGAKACAE